jgi:hypothetical protein
LDISEVRALTSARVVFRRGVCARRTRTEKRVDTAERVIVRVRQLPRDEWVVLIPDHHPGFITWSQYEANILESAAADGLAAGAGAIQLLGAGAHIAGAVARGPGVAGLHGAPALAALRPRMAQEPRSPFPWASHPAARGRRRTPGWGQALSICPGLHLRHQPNLQPVNPLALSSFVSHMQIDTHKLLPCVPFHQAFHQASFVFETFCKPLASAGLARSGGPAPSSHPATADCRSARPPRWWR